MHQPITADLSTSDDTFPTDPAGLPAAIGPALRPVAEGGVLELRMAPVAKRLPGTTVRMLAYNGSIPGPTLLVQQGAEVTVDVVNGGDTEATVHWHGVRLDNRYDGVPYETQAPIPVGGSFAYQVRFPDPGLYWYHPHVREDYGQEMGLYGTIVVRPTEPDYWSPVTREVVITLDDLLLEDGKIAPFSRTDTNRTAMGRFGNVMLTNGDGDLALSAAPGEVVRFFLVNTANTRVFNVGIPGARMKLVGGDSGRYEREQFVDEVLLAPSERAVVEVWFDRPGRLEIEHRTPHRVYPLATVTVAGDPATPSYAAGFLALRTSSELVAERQRITPSLTAEPDKTLALVAEMDLETSERSGPARYACPMHPEVVRDQPGRCPTCGMKLLPEQLAARDSHHGGRHERHGATDGIEWEDDMPEVNRMSNTTNLRWKLVDRDTGAENAAIDWRFTVGQRVKIRLVNEMDSDHPMQHPFHIHGAGRFLVLSRDGTVEPNLVWKDTVLVRTGQVVDVLLDVTNPGRWMAHCHIGEHMASGMMFSFSVSARDAERPGTRRDPSITQEQETR
jgi:FtsP/CotA-like multicopper oxidase with cupredoxin domain